MLLAAALMPRFARLALWRFSLIVDDGFWFDTAKLQFTVWVWATSPVQAVGPVFDQYIVTVWLIVVPLATLGST